MYQKILVPLDGSSFGEHALPMALSIARSAGAAVELLHAHVPEASTVLGGAEVVYDTELDSTMRQEEEKYLADVVRRIPGMAVTSKLLDCPPADAIHEEAIASKADLIVMTTHGRGRISRFWLGSVADELLRQSPIPLLLVRAREDAPSLAATVNIKRVLIPLDGSALSEQILEPALALGGLSGAEYLLVQAIEPIGSIGPHAREMDPAMLRQLQENAQAYLEKLAGPLRARSLIVRTRVLVGRLAATAILEEAQTHHSDLIALATHGRGAVARMLLGSVTDKVLRAANLPVLVFRPLAH